MKITVINGTEVKGCTYHIKEVFLEELRKDNDIKEYYLPRDLPYFCSGCKKCFTNNELLCPHVKYVNKIWISMLESDLIVFTSPVYALRTTAQMKSLLDHLCVHWMVHRPHESMFYKKAVILTNAVGFFNGGAQKDISTSLMWLGVSHIRKLGFALAESVFWNQLSDGRRNRIINKTRRLAKKYRKNRSVHMSLKVKILFAISRKLHQMRAKKETTLSADNQYWLIKGWIKE